MGETEPANCLSLMGALEPWGTPMDEHTRMRVRKSDFPESQNFGKRSLKTIVTKARLAGMCLVLTIDQAWANASRKGMRNRQRHHLP